MTKKVPTYSLHKASGNARVWIAGQNFYLGKYGSDESRVRYAELLTKHATGQPLDPLRPTGETDPGPSVNVICATYIVHAKIYYRKNGKVTAEYHCVKSAMSPLVELFGEFPAKTFDSVALKMVRDKMIADREWCRDYINKSVGRIVRIFRHAAEGKLIPAAVVTELELVRPLEEGRSEAKDYEPRHEVPANNLEAIRGLVDPLTRDMVDLALLTGARGGELTMLKPKMVDKGEGFWVAVLDDHKMRHKGKKRALVFGPQSIVILERNAPNKPDQRFFPVQRRTFSDRIKRACIALNLPPITGHWLRHTSATVVRRKHDLDTAQGLLGHASATTTEKYAGLDLSKTIEFARQHG